MQVNFKAEYQHSMLKHVQNLATRVNAAEMISKNPGKPFSPVLKGQREAPAKIFRDTPYQKILPGPQKASLDRCKDAGYKTITVLQDTTSIRILRKVKGSGKVGQHGRGLYMHSVIIVTPDGIIGLIFQAVWGRKAFNALINESDKWILSLDAVNEFAKQCTETRIVLVQDREADMMRFFTNARETNVYLVTRVFQQRLYRVAGTEPWMKLDDVRATLQDWGEYELQITVGNQEITVKLRIKASAVELGPSKKSPKQVVSGYWLVDVEEVEARDSAGNLLARSAKERITWTLLTSIPVSNLSEALAVIAQYKLRWGNV